MITDKEIQNLTELAKAKSQTESTPEEAMRTFKRLGWMDDDGEFISPYKELLPEIFSREWPDFASK